MKAVKYALLLKFGGLDIKCGEWMTEDSVGGRGLETIKPLIQSSPHSRNGFLKSYTCGTWWGDESIWRPLILQFDSFNLGSSASHHPLPHSTGEGGLSTDRSRPVCSPAFQSAARTLRNSTPRRCFRPASPWAARWRRDRWRSAGERKTVITTTSPPTELQCQKTACSAKTVLPSNGWVYSNKYNWITNSFTDSSSWWWKYMLLCMGVCYMYAVYWGTTLE